MVRDDTTAMMRIAIAGTGGFAELLAQQLSQSAHALLMLSREERPNLEEKYDCQVACVNYENLSELTFILKGVDLVISTISHMEQMNLIDAARRAHVRRFVPSEFESYLSNRPLPQHGFIDPLEHLSYSAREELERWSQSTQDHMDYTVFSCGLFYEHFAPGGLQASNIGNSLAMGKQGDYLIDVGRGTGQIPQSDAQGQPIQLIMTSAADVARFVAAAVEAGIEKWPREITMQGDRLTASELVKICYDVRRVSFDITWVSYENIQAWFSYFRTNNSHEDERHWRYLLHTANGRFASSEPPMLNPHVDFVPLSFQEWLNTVWAPATQPYRPQLTPALSM